MMEGRGGEEERGRKKEEEGGRETPLVSSFSYEDTNPIMSSSNHNYLQKASPPNTITTLGVRASIYELGSRGYKYSVSKSLLGRIYYIPEILFTLVLIFWTPIREILTLLFYNKEKNRTKVQSGRVTCMKSQEFEVKPGSNAPIFFHYDMLTWLKRIG